MEEDCVCVFLNSAIEFIEHFRRIKEKYAFYNNAVQELDKATQDVLHKFELDRLSSGEKCKWATQIANIRRDRRYYKDKAETLRQIIDVIDDIESKNGQFSTDLNKLGNMAGIIRKTHLNKPNRIYTPRVIKEMKINSQRKRVKGE